MKKKETTDVFKAPAKIQSFEEVQKALQGLTQQLNDLGISTNSKAEGEITDKDGKTGDIRITQNKDKTYGLELKTDEGWKFPSVGESPVQLTGKKGEKAKPDAVVDNFKDDLGNPKNMPKPDYDTGFFQAAHQQMWVTGFTDGEYPDDLTDKLKVNDGIFEWYYHNRTDIKGLPPLSFSFNGPPTLIQTVIAPPGCETWEDCLATGQCIIDNGQAYRYLHSWERDGMEFMIIGAKYFLVKMPDYSWHHSPGDGGLGGSNWESRSPQPGWATAHSDDYSSYASLGYPATVRIRIWR